MTGHSAAVLAYGQTGSGKTWCMEGSLASPLEWGLIPYALDEILRQASNSSDRSFLVTVSYIELYREQLYDLLAPPKRGDSCGLLRMLDHWSAA